MTQRDFRLVQCDRSGAPITPVADLPASALEAAAATEAHFRKVGWSPPWVGYLAVLDGRAVGGGAFVAPPQDGRVEIAYYTDEAERGRGVATAVAAALIDIARAQDPSPVLFAKTLPELNASTRILEKLGFRRVGVAVDEEVGDVWLWEL